MLSPVKSLKLTKLSTEVEHFIVTSVILIVLIAIIFTEGILRVIKPYQLAHGFSLSVGVHTRDDHLVAVFTRNFSGYMNYMEKPVLIPFSLDEFGFRKTIPTSIEGQSFREIVLIGGVSVMFGFGVPDELTMASQIVRHSSYPLEIHNTAWPGWHEHINFLSYKHILEENINPELVILNMYHTSVRSVANKPEVYKTPLTQHKIGNQAKLFRYFDNKVTLGPQGIISRHLSHHMYSFHFLDAMVRLIEDKIIKPIKKYKNKKFWKESVYGFLDRDYKSTKENTKYLKHKVHEAKLSNDEALARAVEWVVFYKNYFNQRGSAFLLVFLPHSYQVDYQFQDELIPNLSSNIEYLDLRKELPKEMPEEIYKKNFIAGGHYNPDLNRKFGGIMANKIDAILSRK